MRFRPALAGFAYVQPPLIVEEKWKKVNPEKFFSEKTTGTALQRKESLKKVLRPAGSGSNFDTSGIAITDSA